MKVLVISGGNIDFDFALSFLKNKTFDEVIAVDGGLECAYELEQHLPRKMLGFRHIVGDFDTVDTRVLERYRNRQSMKIYAYKPEKDYTDTDIALKLAMSLCQKVLSENADNKQTPQIVILGATGTRLDHVLANLQMLRLPMEAGIDAVIVDAYNRIRMIEHQYAVTESFGKYVSLIPVSEVLRGIDLVGFKYPLDHQTVYLGESLCVSNELIEDKGYIRIREGRALLIESKD